MARAARTPKSDEPQTQAEPAEAEAPLYDRRDDQVYFESANPEPNQFYIEGNKGFRLNDGRVAWRFPKADADRIKKHFHVVTGRVREA